MFHWRSEKKKVMTVMYFVTNETRYIDLEMAGFATTENRQKWEKVA